MPASQFATVASQVAADLHSRRHLHLVRSATVDRDAEWQRVNSYIADVLKDIHVLYAKLARLQGDFAGRERAELEKVSEEILSLGDELSKFSKAFYEGALSMAETDVTYGGSPSQGQPAPPAPAPEPPPAPAPEEAAGEGGEDVYDVPVEVEEEEEAPAEGQEQGQ